MDDPVARAITSTNRSPAKTRWYRHPQRIEQSAEVSGGQVSDVSQHQSVEVVAPFPIFFDLCISQERPGGDPPSPNWETLHMPLQLEANHRYRIRITTTPNQAMNQGTTQYPVMVVQDMQVYVQTSQSIPALTLGDVSARVKPEEIEEFEHDVLLEVGPECPIASLFLELIYEENHNRKIAARLPLELRGSYHEIDDELSKRVGIDTTTRPPDSMALLHIETPVQGKLRLSCWNRRPLPNRPSFLQPVDQPELGLDSLGEKAHDPGAVQDVIDRIRDFFALSVPELSEWFSGMIQRHQEQCCVVILDETAANVPWEMMETDEGKFLGAQVSVVRWMKAQYRQLRAILHLHDSEQHTGELLAYVHPQDHDHTRQQSPTLAHLAPRIHESEESMKPFLTSQALAKLGMVYLRYRGSLLYGNESSRLQLILSASYGEPVKVRFESVEAPSGTPLEQRPVVFVNACHSARAHGDASSGLMQVLLAKFGGGYIGTLGPIEPSFAVRIAERILLALNTANGETTLTEIFMRLRQQAAERYILDATSSVYKLDLLYTFLYVYFGNPYARLRIIDTSESDRQQEQSDDRP